MALRYYYMLGHAVTKHIVYSTILQTLTCRLFLFAVGFKHCGTGNLTITGKMLGFIQPTSAKLYRLSLIEGTGSLLSS